MTRKFLAVDGNNLMMRALHATAHAAMSSHGNSTGALYVFINSLTKLIREHEPEYLAVAWDGGASAWRKKLYPDYKANRKAAPEEIEANRDFSFSNAMWFCSNANIHHIRMAGHEADDIIASWWGQVDPQRCDRMTIVSSDKDFLQLLGSSPLGVEVDQVRLSSADTPTDHWTAARFEEVNGCPPSWYPAVLALWGDTSDNVVGVKGIGPKKAVKALWAAEGDYARVVETWPEDVARLLVNYQLVDLRHTEVLAPLPPPFIPPEAGHPQYAELERFFDEHEMSTLTGRLISGQLFGRPLPAGTDEPLALF